METLSPGSSSTKLLPTELKPGNIVDRGRYGRIKISGPPEDRSYQDPASGRWETKPAWPFRNLDEEFREDGTVGEICFNARKKVRVVNIQPN